MPTAPTPSSENTVYFDAPIAHFHSNPSTTSMNQDQPIQNVDSDLSRQPTVAIAGEPESKRDMREDSPVTEVGSSTVDNRPIHPNGSAGWLPTEGGDYTPASPSQTHRTGSILKRSSQPTAQQQLPQPLLSSRNSTRGSIGSNLRHGRASSLGYAESIGHKSTFTNAEGRPVNGSTFINGAGTTGPNAVAEPDESIHMREQSANNALTPKQKSKIVKKEAQEAKRLSKIIRQEGKVEKKALGVALQELTELQKVQKMAVKREAKAHTSHAKAQVAVQKAEAAFLEAKTKYETAQAQLNAETEALEVTRNSARQATENMQEKSQEIDSLRTMYGVDERERQVKIVELTGKQKSRWR